MAAAWFVSPAKIGDHIEQCLGDGQVIALVAQVVVAAVQCQGENVGVYGINQGDLALNSGNYDLSYQGNNLTR